MTVAKIGTRLGGYLAFKHYQGNTNVTNPGRAACASHTGEVQSEPCHLCLCVSRSLEFGEYQSFTPCVPCVQGLQCGSHAQWRKKH